MSLTRQLKDKPLDKWLQTELNSVFDANEEWKAVDPYIHPSSSYHKCSRNIQLSMLGYRGTMDRTSYRVLTNGTYMHLRWTEYFQSIPSFVAADVPFESFEARGTCDILLKDRYTKKLVVGELKSINPNGYQMLPTPSTPEENMIFFKGMYPTYMSQILMYMENVTWENLAPADTGFFLFENKANQAYKIYSVKYDKQMSDELRLNARIALANTRAGLMIEPSLDKTSLTCARCNKFEVCWALAENTDQELTNKINGRLENAKD